MIIERTCRLPKKKKKETQAEQSKAFIEKARELVADTDRVATRTCAVWRNRSGATPLRKRRVVLFPSGRPIGIA